MSASRAQTAAISDPLQERFSRATKTIRDGKLPRPPSYCAMSRARRSIHALQTAGSSSGLPVLSPDPERQLAHRVEANADGSASLWPGRAASVLLTKALPLSRLSADR